jgi:glycosyltransferase EpsF
MSEKYLTRILHVVGRLSRGGAETMIMNLYRACNKGVVQFDFLVYGDSDGSFDREIEDLGGRIIYLRRTNKLSIFQYYRNFKNIIYCYGPYKAIHVHTSFHSGLVLLCAKILKIPVRICHAHSTSDRNNSSKIRTLYQMVMRKMILFCSTQLLACGRDAGHFLYGCAFDIRGSVFPNAIDYIRYNSVTRENIEKCIKELGLDYSGIIIGSVASFREAKNHMFMLDIAEEMKKQGLQFKMVFAGGGSLFNDIKFEVEKRHLSDKILFLGIRDDVPVLMKVFDVMLMPSLYEGLPVTLVETQASNICAVISENITDEVDFNLGLIKKVSLKADVNIWISELLKGAKLKNSVPQQYVESQLSKNGYLAQDSVNLLYRVYNINNSDNSGNKHGN